MRSLDSPSVEVAIHSPERHDASSSSTNDSSLHSSRGEAKHLMERLNTAHVKVKRLQRLEAALVDFFMEVMARREGAAVESESTVARGKRKDQFLKKAEGDPISLLNALRTHLRLQFAEQEAQQAAAERRALADKLSSQQKDQQSREEFQQLEAACQQLKQQQSTLMRQLNQDQVDHARSRRQQQALLDKLNAQVQDERAQRQAAEQSAAKQQEEIVGLREAREVLGRQKSLEGAARTADSMPATASAATSASPAHTTGDFFGTPAENQTLRRALRKYELQLAQTEATSEERKREVQRLQQQLTGLRQSTQLQRYSRLEKEARHVRELADDLKTRLAESDADLLRTKGALKERELEVHKMKDEYARLFHAVQRQKQPGHYSPSKLARSASTMKLTPQLHHAAGTTEAPPQQAETATCTANGENPYVVEHYRSEAARIEREAEALKLQIRRMMASEQLQKQKTRVLRSEKQSLTRERDQLRADLDHAKRHSTLQSIAVSRPQTHSSVASRKVGFTTAPLAVKQLQKRNAFLEERFRKSLQSKSTLATIGAVARLRSSMSVPSGLSGGDAVVTPEREGDEADDQVARVPRPNSAILTSTRPASALATSSETQGGSFRSLDPATLQSLQQVKRATRVRPHSANPSK